MVSGELESFRERKRWLRKDGSIVESMVSLRCVRHRDSRIKYFVLMLEDLTGMGAAVGLPEAAKTLSRQERVVLGLLGSGASVKEIANRLDLSDKTVSTYRSRLLTKLGLRSTGELIRFALSHGYAT